MTVMQIYEHFSEPERLDIRRIDEQPLGPEAPPYAVPPAYFWSIGDERLAQAIKIIDFGEAHTSEDRRTCSRTPLPFRAPESYFNEPVDAAADIWALACVAFRIFGCKPLFIERWMGRDSMLLDMFALLGSFPVQWRDKWDTFSKFFADDGQPKANQFSALTEPKPLSLRICEMRSDGHYYYEGTIAQFSDQDLTDVLKLLSATLKYLPSERATAQELLEIRWIREEATEPDHQISDPAALPAELLPAYVWQKPPLPSSPKQKTLAIASQPGTSVGMIPAM